LTDADKTAAHISPGLVRLSVGYTGTAEQRWKQLSEALQRVGATPEKQIA
jgi:methionine-gamma-lyase